MKKVIRGTSLLDYYLAQKRAKCALENILSKHHHGKILDIGCGIFPLFLTKAPFQDKYAIERNPCSGLMETARLNDIRLFKMDLEHEDKFPFDDNTFEVISILSVIEHIETVRWPKLFKDIRRILKDNGQLLIIAPSAWADFILKLLAMVGLASKEEIEEHKDVYNHKKIIRLLDQAGFNKDNIHRKGYFNLYTTQYLSVFK